MWITATNTNPDRSLDYRTLSAADLGLVDDLGTIYPRFVFPGGMVPVRRVEAASVKPGDMVFDGLYFHPPHPAAEYLDLDISAGPSGKGRTLRFRIPSEVWKRKR